MLLDYVNGALEYKERVELLRHISGCAECREELAELLMMKRMVEDSRIALPNDIRSSAFELIPESKGGTERHGGIITLALTPVANAVRPASDALSLVGKTVKIAVSIM